MQLPPSISARYTLQRILTMVASIGRIGNSSSKHTSLFLPHTSHVTQHVLAVPVARHRAGGLANHPSWRPCASRLPPVLYAQSQQLLRDQLCPVHSLFQLVCLLPTIITPQKGVCWEHIWGRVSAVATTSIQPDVARGLLGPSRKNTFRWAEGLYCFVYYRSMPNRQ